VVGVLGGGKNLIFLKFRCGDRSAEINRHLHFLPLLLELGEALRRRPALPWATCTEVSYFLASDAAGESAHDCSYWQESCMEISWGVEFNSLLFVVHT
jgi:hypothetical protein